MISRQGNKSCHQEPEITYKRVGIAPAGFRVAPGSGPESYTKTGCAQEVIHEGTGIVMVYVPAGSFMMGSPASEAERLEREGPIHKVSISKGFYLGKYQVTQDEWQKLMGSNPSHYKNAGNLAPVESVSWNECQDFCHKAGSGMRLPTEAEWEYACRAGTRTTLYNGEMKIVGTNNAPALDPIAWYGGNCGVYYEGGVDSSQWAEKQYDHTRASTHPVGRKLPNSWGLYDMIGNVWEWCQDWYDGDYYKNSPERDLTGPISGANRVLSGGSWVNGAGNCRTAYRGSNWPGYRGNIVGLRVAAAAP